MTGNDLKLKWRRPLQRFKSKQLTMHMESDKAAQRTVAQKIS